MEKEQINDNKPSIVIFDLDGCIANSDDFVLTNIQAWEKDKEVFARPGLGYRGPKPRGVIAKQFSLAYLHDHHNEIEPYYGIFDMFVRTAMVTNVAIVTSRPDILKAVTMQWLEKHVIQRYSMKVWRQLLFQTYFNETKEKSLIHKKNIFTQLMKKYSISLVVEDHPQVVDWAKSKGLTVLVPATGYKNLNGNDIATEEDEVKLKRRKKKTDDNLQKK